MYERKRRAIDVAGRNVEIVERHVDALDVGSEYSGAAEFLGPDGERLIPEGYDFYRTPFGVLFKVVD